MAEINWQIIGLFMTIGLAWTGFLVGVIKYLIDRGIRSNDQKIKDLEKEVAKESEDRLDLERSFNKLMSEMPLKYVQREDWIRLATTIDTKMDALNQKLDDIKDAFYARS